MIVPSYTFDAQTTDYTERFNLTYASTTGINENDNPFAFYADREIRLIKDVPNTTLQIIDMQGHIVKICTDATCIISTNEIPTGIYVLQLINDDDVKTQKIVIR